MKVIAISFLLVIGGNALCQDTLPNKYYPVSNYETNVLYREYDNKVAFSAPDFYDTLLMDTAPESTLTPYKNGVVVLNFGNANRRIAKIVVRGVKNGDTNTVSIHEFRLMDLPTPTVYSGTIELSNDSQHACTKLESVMPFDILFVKYPPEIPLNEQFVITEWVIFIGDKKYTGEDKYLSDELMRAIEKSDKGTVITFNSVKVNSTHRSFDIEVDRELIKSTKKNMFKYQTEEMIYIDCDD